MDELNKVAIVIVTYNRCDYLKNLLSSISLAQSMPWRIIIVDNASTDDTPQVIKHYEANVFNEALISIRLVHNTGGSGGFNAGVAHAYGLGADWFWLMDDDVLTLPNGLTDLLRWGQQFKCLHGRRYDFDGSNFHWQPQFNEFLASPLPVIGNPFKHQDYMLNNSGCFEGMFIHRTIVQKIGFPDPRFFITWDDAVYAWLASRVTEVAYVNSFVLQRARPQRQINLGIRHLNDASDLFRFHVVRNRAYVAKYFAHYSVLNKFGYSLGTFLNICKEITRLLLVERSFKGLGVLYKGWRESKKILADNKWQPMPPL